VTFGQWLRSPAATKQLAAAVSDNHRIDAAMLQIPFISPCRTCGRPAQYIGRYPVVSCALYECEAGHHSLVESA
jgi:hypothetical protein